MTSVLASMRRLKDRAGGWRVAVATSPMAICETCQNIKWLKGQMVCDFMGAQNL